MPPVEEFALDHLLGPAEAPFVFNCEDLWQHQDPLLDVMRRCYGHRPVDSLGGSYGWSVRYRQIEDYAAAGINTLGEYIDAFRAGTPGLPYLRHLSVYRAMPELRQYIRTPAEFRPNWVDRRWLDRFSGPEFFIGQAGSTFGNLHQDHASVHVGFVQLEGAKEFTVLPPEDGASLYRMRGRQFPFQLRNSALRLDTLTDYATYPDLRYVSPQKFTLCAGQALFLPADWWHTTRNLTDSVSFTIRIVNSSNIGACVLRHLEGLPYTLSKAFGGN